MIDLVELFLHWDAGRSKHELAASLGMDRKTVRKYQARRKRRAWYRGKDCPKRGGGTWWMGGSPGCGMAGCGR